jgi:hypothetical protein
MDCRLTTIYALLSTSGIDHEEMCFGQLCALAAGLLLLFTGHLLLYMWS